MKITPITIWPKRAWRTVSDKNPLRAAQRNIEQFVAAVSGGHAQMIEGENK